LTEEQIEREHQQIVDELRVSLTVWGVAHRRPQMVYNALYHPDLVVTVDGVKFIPIEVINSSYGFDTLGMLSLVMTKDIIDSGVCIVTERLYNQAPEKYQEVQGLLEKFRVYSKQTYGNNLVLLREHEVESYFKERIKGSEVWIP